jgi:molybdopterin-containing oxidoreductase family iron-sulfur binding subunit
MGRPVGISGNPLHPASLGAIDPFSQVQLLEFYDPDRGGGITHRAVPTDRPDLERTLVAERSRLASSRGAGLCLLSGSVSSPTLIRQLEGVLAAYPQARWVTFDPVSRAAVREAAMQAYGQPVEVLPRLEAVDVLLSIEGDLFGGSPGWLSQARAFASRRNPTRTERMMRVYAIESTPTLVGAVADHRIIATPAEIRAAMPRLLERVSGAPAAGSAGTSADDPPWLAALSTDLAGARGRAFVHVGAQQSTALHVLGHVLNEHLQGRGRTYDLTPAVTAPAKAQLDALDGLTADMHAGRVDALVLIDTNPCYTARGSLGFGEALKRVRFSLTLSAFEHETAHASSWWVPEVHPLESWGDACAFEGSISILQPQSLPLHDGMSATELLGLLTSMSPSSAEQAVQSTWRDRLGLPDAPDWREALSRGVITGSASRPVSPALRPGVAQSPAVSVPASVHDEPAGLELLLRPDPSLWDGRYANNPWLQELPRPLTKLVWDNPLLIAPALARSLQVRNGDRVQIGAGTLALNAPVWIVPGQSPRCITAWIGSGRRNAGTVGNGQGIDFYPLAGFEGPVRLRRIEGRQELASTEHHQLLLDTPGDILKHGTLEQFMADARFARNQHPEAHLYRTVPPGPAAWGMSVDLNACIGCNACVVACQAENNISVVGREEVLREREMHWLRIDRYYEGSTEAPRTYFQPVLCMHCEQAPCENVCPVGATVHDSEGLNVMVYNRCVGTRFCSNNCPYKVRRFNFFAYGHEQHRPAESWNPDVTVRARGVMEKCTYCIQRIAEARIAADRDSRPIGEVQTACQAACPTRAFTFGNMAEPQSAVLERKRSPLAFAMLEEQNTVPRTTYEALVRNPNPALREPPA